MDGYIILKSIIGNNIKEVYDNYFQYICRYENLSKVKYNESGLIIDNADARYTYNSIGLPTSTILSSGVIFQDFKYDRLGNIIYCNTYENDKITGSFSRTIVYHEDIRQSTNKPKITRPKNSNVKSSEEGCYIATAVYGSYDCSEVYILRRFRDDVLYNKFLGRIFIKIYYACSPILVKYCGHLTLFQSFWKKILDRVIIQLKLRGFEESPVKRNKNSIF